MSLEQTLSVTKDDAVKPTKVRWYMLSLIMLVTCINYLDRANLAVAAPVMQKELGLNAAMMGIIFSAFGWAYTVMLPFAGAFLDKYGPRMVYTVGIIGWSLMTALIGVTNSVMALIGCRIGVGAFESPAFPTNVRCVTAWHPATERAFAVGLYTATQYVALGLLTPVLAWMLINIGWQAIFFLTGGVGLIVAWLWHRDYRDPQHSQAANEAELDYIKAGDGLSHAGDHTKVPFSWYKVRQLLSHRQVWGIFIGQFSVMTTLFFFLTWFPTYLVTAKGMTILKSGFYAAVPFLVAIVGTLVGGRWSDWMVVAGYSNSTARKLPIIVGLLLSCVILGANYTNSIPAVISCMAVAFFGQAMASTVSGALLSDIAPQGLIGILSGMFYFVANVGGTLAPMVIGFMVNATGNFNMALVYVSAVAVVGTLSYVFIVGKVYRISLTDDKGAC